MNTTKSLLVNTFKSFNVVTLIFLLISFYLTRQDNIYVIVLGYVSIIWWSFIILTRWVKLN
jgi:hypothetical protein